MKKKLLVILLSICGVGSLSGISKLTIITGDGQRFMYGKEEIAALSSSETMSNLIDDFKHQENITITLSTINAPCWRIIEKCMKILFEAENLTDTDKAKKLKAVDTILSTLDHNNLHSFINGSNFLNISNLLDSALNEWLSNHELTLFEENNTHYQFNQNVSDLLHDKVRKCLHQLFAPDSEKDVRKICCCGTGSQEISSLCYSPDGEYIASGGINGSIDIWNAKKTIRLHNVCEGIHFSKIAVMRYSPNAKYLASASTNDKKICLWNSSSGKTSHLEGHTSSINTITFSPDSSAVASTSRDHTVRIWDTVADRLIFAINLPSKGNVIHYSPDGSCIAVGCDDGIIRIHNAQTGMLVYNLSGHSKSISSICYSPDGQYLASGSADLTIRLWNAKNGTLVHELPAAYFASLAQMCYSPDGNFIACASFVPIPSCYISLRRDRDNHIQIWDTKSGKLVQKLKCYGLIRSIGYNPSGTLLVSNTNYGNLSIWDIRTNTHKLIYYDECSRLELSPNGKFITVPNGTSLSIWDISRLIKKHTLLLWLAAKKEMNDQQINWEQKLFCTYKALYEKFKHKDKERAFSIQSS